MPDGAEPHAGKAPAGTRPASAPRRRKAKQGRAEGAEKPVPVAAAYALAEAFTREWWDAFPTAKADGLGRARHRTEIEVPRAQKLLRLLWGLPAMERRAIASAIVNAPREKAGRPGKGGGTPVRPSRSSRRESPLPTA